VFTVEIVAAIGSEHPTVVERAAYGLEDIEATIRTAKLLLETVKQDHPDSNPDGIIITDQLTGAALHLKEKRT
jgi:hypothetical protein